MPHFGARGIVHKVTVVCNQFLRKAREEAGLVLEQ